MFWSPKELVVNGGIVKKQNKYLHGRILINILREFFQASSIIGYMARGGNIDD